jgi:hypothetical protein
LSLWRPRQTLSVLGLDQSMTERTLWLNPWRKELKSWTLDSCELKLIESQRL